MIGTSLPEYVLIRIAITFLRFTSPILLGCLCLSALLYGPIPAFTWLALGYAALDLAYALFIWIPYTRRLRDECDHPPPLPRAERRAMLERCLAHTPDTERYLRLWFLGAAPGEIRRENLREFLLWAFLDRNPGEDDATDAEELDEYIGLIERNLGHEVPPGRGSAEGGLRLTLDPVETRYRSVIWYLIIGIVDFVTHCQLARCGFQYHAQPRSSFLSVIPQRIQSLFTSRRSAAPDMGYWHRPHTAKDKLPIVFLHGIGVGLWTYVSFLSSLNKGAGEDEQIGIIAIEYLPVSFRLTGAPLRKADYLHQVTAILASHDGWDRFVLASHSYGSVLATHMFQSEALGPRIESAMFVDPVTLLLHLPDVAVNFTRRQPQRANEWLLWYFASMDPGVAHCLGRHFFWKDNIIWKEELVDAIGTPAAVVEAAAPFSSASGDTEFIADLGSARRRKRRVAVCLAEYDLIVNTLAVAQYLAGDEEWYQTSTGQAGGGEWNGAGKSISHEKPERGHMTKDGIELLWFPGFDHAQVFDAKQSRNRLCSVLQRYCAQ